MNNDMNETSFQFQGRPVFEDAETFELFTNVDGEWVLVNGPLEDM